MDVRTVAVTVLAARRIRFFRRSRCAWDREDGMGRLLEVTRRLKMYLTIPAAAQRGVDLYNSIYLASPESVWCYKVSPARDELDKGIRLGRFNYCDWRRFKVGGAICFDTCFPESLTRQAAEEVER